MKIKIFLIIIFNVIFSQNFSNNNIEKKQNSLEEIDTQINELENKLAEQINNQKGAVNQLNTIIEKINVEKEKLIENQNQEQYQAELLKQANYIIDSL